MRFFEREKITPFQPRTTSTIIPLSENFLSSAMQNQFNKKKMI